MICILQTDMHRSVTSWPQFTTETKANLVLINEQHRTKDPASWHPTYQRSQVVSKWPWRWLCLDSVWDGKVFQRLNKTEWDNTGPSMQLWRHRGDANHTLHYRRIERNHRWCTDQLPTRLPCVDVASSWPQLPKSGRCSGFWANPASQEVLSAIADKIHAWCCAGGW